MKWKILLLASIILLFAFSSSSNFRVEANGLLEIMSVYWGEPGNPVEVDFGDTGVPLTIVVRNSGSNSIINIFATLYLVDPFRSVEGKSRAMAYYVGSVPPSGTLHLTFYLNINEWGSYGYYSLQLGIDFSEVIRGAYLDRHESLTVKVPLLGKADLVFKLDRNFIAAGTLSILKLIVENKGSLDALNVKVNIQSLSQAVLINASELQFKSVKPHSMIEVPISIYVPKSLLGSKISISIDGSYTSAYGFERKLSHKIGLVASSSIETQYRIEVEAENYILTAGSFNNTVNIRVRNCGSKVVKLLTLKISVPSNLAILGEDNKWFIGNIEPGDEVEVPIKIYVPAKLVGSSIQVTLELTYLDEHGFQLSENRKIGFTIIGYIDMQMVSLSISPSTAEAGDIFTISGAVRNDGISTASNVRVSIESREGIIEPLAMESVFIGSLSPGSQAPFSLSVRVKDDVAPGRYTITIKVVFKDELGKEHFKSYPIQVSVKARRQVGAIEAPARGERLFTEIISLNTIITATIAFILGLVFSYFYFKRKSGEELELEVEK